MSESAGVFTALLLASTVLGGCGEGSHRPAPEPAISYSTEFARTENPLSEGGSWSNNGNQWTPVQTVDHVAYGTNGLTNSYDDSYAYLSGFPPDQEGEAVIYRSPSITGSPHEVELLLRWADSPDHARGYECLFNDMGVVQIVRWNGPFGDFTVLGDGQLGRQLVTGDVVRANVVGKAISAYINDRRIARASDSVWPAGQPGIGFFRRSQGSSSDLGLTKYTAKAK
jgi:hypothetical protein